MPSRSIEPALRVPPGFEDEFPGASRRATELFINLGMLAGAARAAIDRLVVGEGLPSVAAFNVLSVLAGDPQPLRPSVIAERMTVSRATITGVLDSLESRGLVRRTAGAGDKRSRDVAITAEGRAVTGRLVPRLHAFEAELGSVLSDRQLEQVLHAVALLQRRIGEVDPGATLGIR